MDGAPLVRASVIARATCVVLLCVALACGGRGAQSTPPIAASPSADARATDRPPANAARQDVTQLAREAFAMARSLELRHDERMCKPFYVLPDDWTKVTPALSHVFPRHAADVNVHVFRLESGGEWFLSIEAQFIRVDASDIPQTVDEDRARLEAAGIVDVVRETRDASSPPNSFRLVHERADLEIFVARTVADLADEGRVGVIYDGASILVPLKGLDATTVIDDAHVRHLSVLPATSSMRLERRSVPMRDYLKEAERLHDRVWRFSGAPEALLLESIDGLERFSEAGGVELAKPYFRKLTPTRPGVLVRRDADGIDWEYENPRATVTVYSDPIPPSCR